MAEWQPGDPVYVDERNTNTKHCGPCLTSWTAAVDYCDCGLPTTEQLLADRVRLAGENAALRARIARLTSEVAS